MYGSREEDFWDLVDQGWIKQTELLNLQNGIRNDSIKIQRFHEAQFGGMKKVSLSLSPALFAIKLKNICPSLFWYEIFKYNYHQILVISYLYDSQNLVI